jgi:hypothetical protein
LENYAYSLTRDAFLNWREVVAMNWQQRFQIWYYYHVLGHSLILSVLLLSPLSFVAIYIFKPKLYNISLYVFGIVCYLGCLLWATNAPDWRLGFAFLVMVVVVNVYFWLGAWLAKLFRLGALWFVLVGLAWAAILQKDSKNGKLKLGTHILLVPATYPVVKPYMHRLGNITQYVARKEDYEYSCWDTPLPCSDHFKPYLELRGETLREGFRVNWEKIRALSKEKK